MHEVRALEVRVILRQKAEGRRLKGEGRRQKVTPWAFSVSWDLREKLSSK